MACLFFSRQRGARPRGEHGFSIIEFVVVLGIMAALAGMAGLQIIQARPSIQGDGALRVVLSQMRMARELAITERRFVRVVFVPASVVQTVRENVPGPSTTTLNTVSLEGGFEFQLTAGLPDTPDAFGNAQAINFGTATTVKFTPDGTLVNQDGVTINGSVFVAQPGSALASRAITVLGSTGRLRGYRWDGRAWTLV